MQVPAQNPTENPSIIPEFWRCTEVVKRVHFSRSTLLRRVADGSFPAPVHLSVNIVAWRSADVLAWIANVGRAAA